MQIAKTKIDELRAMLEMPRRVVILSHTNPDGDAIGSSLAWAEVLKRHGHEVTCIIPNKYPYYLEFMPEIDSVVIFKSDKESEAIKAVKAAHGKNIAVTIGSIQCEDITYKIDIDTFVANAEIVEKSEDENDN